jgi:hypothetical protein
MQQPSIAERCYALSGLFEAELLVELMLRHWGHPMAADRDFRNALLESAVDVLKSSIGGEELIEGIPPDQVNLVMAIWFAEWSSLNEASSDEPAARKEWLEKVKRAIPSCYSDQDALE